MFNLTCRFCDKFSETILYQVAWYYHPLNIKLGFLDGAIFAFENLDRMETWFRKINIDYQVKLLQKGSCFGTSRIIRKGPALRNRGKLHDILGCIFWPAIYALITRYYDII